MKQRDLIIIVSFPLLSTLAEHEFTVRMELDFHPTNASRVPHRLKEGTGKRQDGKLALSWYQSGRVAGGLREFAARSRPLHVDILPGCDVSKA
jgi:hypothetical protein